MLTNMDMMMQLLLYELRSASVEFLAHRFVLSLLRYMNDFFLFFSFESSCRSGPVGNTEKGHPTGNSELYPRRTNSPDSPFSKHLLLFTYSHGVVILLYIPVALKLFIELKKSFTLSTSQASIAIMVIGKQFPPSTPK